jgi:hypothetical protein
MRQRPPVPLLVLAALTCAGRALAGDPSNWDLQREQDRFYAGLEGGLAFTMPVVGGVDTAQGGGDGGSGIPLGGYALAMGGYRYRSGFLFGVEAGYLRTGDSSSSRSTAVNVPGQAPAPGTVDDALLLQGGLIGATVGFRIPVAVILTPELGTGVFIGTLADRVTGNFCPTATGSGTQEYCVDVGEVGWATSFYLRPAIRLGFQFGKHVEAYTSLGSFFLFTAGRPAWTPGAGQVQTPSGVGTLSPVNLTGTAVWVLLSTFGIRGEI